MSESKELREAHKRFADWWLSQHGRDIAGDDPVDFAWSAWKAALSQPPEDADAFERGRQMGARQERALWKLSADAQAMGDYGGPQPPAGHGAEPVGWVRIDSGEVHILPRVRDADLAGLYDGQGVYAAPPAEQAGAGEVPSAAALAELIAADDAHKHEAHALGQAKKLAFFPFGETVTISSDGLIRTDDGRYDKYNAAVERLRAAWTMARAAAPHPPQPESGSKG